MSPIEKSKYQSDYREALYEHYVTQQVGVDVATLRDQHERPQPYFERLIATHFPADKNAAILDVGCGSGLFLHVLRKAGYRRLEGVEVSKEQVEVAHTLGMDCVRYGDLVVELANVAERYDVVVAFDVLEHFGKEEVLDVLTAVFRALRPGGKLIAHVPNGEAIFPGKIFFGDFTHQLGFTAKSVRQVALYAGFSEVQCHEDRPIVHGVFSTVRAMLWWAVRTCFRMINMVETGDTGKELILSQNLLAVCRKQ